jgi:hypothetical protein
MEDEMSKRKLKEPEYAKSYRNAAENAFAEHARRNGWDVTKRGYPDFICYRGGEMMLVEVKPDKGHRLKKDQTKFKAEMERRGVRVYRWSPDKDWLCLDRRGNMPAFLPEGIIQ